MLVTWLGTPLSVLAFPVGCLLLWILACSPWRESWLLMCSLGSALWLHGQWTSSDMSLHALSSLQATLSVPSGGQRESFVSVLLEPAVGKESHTKASPGQGSGLTRTCHPWTLRGSFYVLLSRRSNSQGNSLGDVSGYVVVMVRTPKSASC